MEILNEEWRDIKNYEGLYQVSNFGRVRSLKYMHKNLTETISQSLNKGYLRVQLHKNATRKVIFVHRLVAFAFPEICGEWFEGAEINHKNEIRTDNRAENLEWCTVTYNINYGGRTKTATRIDNPNRGKAVLQFDKNGNLIREWLSSMQIERELGFKQTNVNACCNNKPHYNTAYGYIWKFKEQA